MVDVRRDIMDTRIHAYEPIYVVLGRKSFPKDNVTPRTVVSRIRGPGAAMEKGMSGSRRKQMGSNHEAASELLSPVLAGIARKGSVGARK